MHITLSLGVNLNKNSEFISMLYNYLHFLHITKIIKVNIYGMLFSNIFYFNLDILTNNNRI